MQQVIGSEFAHGSMAGCAADGLKGSWGDRASHPAGIERGDRVASFDPRADGTPAEPWAERLAYAAGPAPELFERMGGAGGAAGLRPGPTGAWRTHNFEVEEHHTYVAGGVRVHNESKMHNQSELLPYYRSLAEAKGVSLYEASGGKSWEDEYNRNTTDVAFFNDNFYLDKPHLEGQVKVRNGGGFRYVDALGDNDDRDQSSGAGSRSSSESDAARRNHDFYMDRQQEERTAAPVVLDLDGDGVEIAASRDVAFDMDGDGYLERTGWAASDDGLLVIDLDADGTRGRGDGRIDQTRELVLGAWFEGKGYSDLEALARFDWRQGMGGNEDGRLDARDGIWDELRVWRDRDQDGEVDDGELRTLSQHGITRIDYHYDGGASFGDESEDVTVFGHTLHGAGSFWRGGERVVGGVGDVSLGFDRRGYHLERSGDRVTVQLETGDVWRLAELDGRGSRDVDLERENLDGATGDDRDNRLDAEGHHRAVTIAGGEGDDVIHGGTMADLLSGDAGADKLDGGRGNDTVFFDAADVSVSGGYGWDVAMAVSERGVRLELDEADFEVAHGAEGDDVLTAKGSSEDNALHGNLGDDRLYGGFGGDRLGGDGGSDELWGRDGDDALMGGTGADELSGGSDDDRLVGGRHDDELRGDDGDDWLLGGYHHDDLEGGAGDDWHCPHQAGGSGSWSLGLNWWVLAWSFSTWTGDRHLSAECRRTGLQKASMELKAAMRASAWERRRRCSSSASSEERRLSHMAWSWASACRAHRGPDACFLGTRAPKARDVCCEPWSARDGRRRAACAGPGPSRGPRGRARCAGGWPSTLQG